MLSSHSLAWSGFIAQQRHHPPCTLTVPPLRAHLVTIYNGLPCKIVQRRDGKTRQSIRQAGDISIVPVGTESYWSMAFETRVLNLDFSTEFVRKVALECNLDPDQTELINHFDVRDAFLEQIGGLLKIELETGGLGGRLMAESFGTALVVHLLRHYSICNYHIPAYFGGLSSTDKKQVIDYIHAHLEQDLSLATLAGIVNLSQFHFTRLFKQSTGFAPHQYVIRARVEAAKQLLATGRLSVGEVASRTGFTHQSHLASHMKRLLGITPKSIQKNRKNLSQHSTNLIDFSS